MSTCLAPDDVASAVSAARQLGVVDLDDVGSVERVLDLVRCLDGVSAKAKIAATRAAERHRASGKGDRAEVTLSRRLGRSEANKVRKRSSTMGRAPDFEAALAAGAIDVAHVDALSGAVAKNEKVLDHQADLAMSAATMGPDEFGDMCQRLAFLESDDGGVSILAKQRKQSTFRKWRDRATGMFHLSGCLDPQRGAELFTVLDHHVEQQFHAGDPHPDHPVRDVADPEVSSGESGDQVERLTDEQRLANAVHDLITRDDVDDDALAGDESSGSTGPATEEQAVARQTPNATDGAGVADGAYAGHAAGGAGGSATGDRSSPDEAFVSPSGRGRRAKRSRRRRGMRVTLHVHVDLQTLLHGLHEASVVDLTRGGLLPVETIRRMACDADIVPHVLGGSGVVLDQGRKRRLATSEQRWALRAMYRTCMHPGCQVDFDDCVIHHVTPWERLGRTDLGVLGPLCNRHHHDAHEGRWQYALDPISRQLTIRRPDGTLHSITGPLSGRPPTKRPANTPRPRTGGSPRAGPRSAA